MRKYDDELKQQALKKVFDGQSVASVSEELGVNPSIVHKWKRDAVKNGASSASGLELQEIIALKKHLRELEKENEN